MDRNQYYSRLVAFLCLVVFTLACDSNGRAPAVFIELASMQDNATAAPVTLQSDNADNSDRYYFLTPGSTITTPAFGLADVTVWTFGFSYEVVPPSSGEPDMELTFRIQPQGFVGPDKYFFVKATENASTKQIEIRLEEEGGVFYKDISVINPVGNRRYVWFFSLYTHRAMALLYNDAPTLPISFLVDLDDELGAVTSQTFFELPALQKVENFFPSDFRETQMTVELVSNNGTNVKLYGSNFAITAVPSMFVP